MRFILYRLYGLREARFDQSAPYLEIRRQRSKGCWVQDPIQAAMLGLTDVARDYVSFNLAKDPNVRFPAFWDHGNDYIPDEDNGGNGMHGLTRVMQSVAADSASAPGLGRMSGTPRSSCTPPSAPR